MSDPLVPNFNPGVGRLTTDRFDFQKHLDGYPFRHNAGQIDLTPSVVIDGYYQHTVQAAIQAISTVAFPPIIPDATGSTKGIIRLNGDLTGTALNPTVSGLRTYPVSAAAPSVGNVLTYNGSLWGPAAPANSFTAGGDLTGTNTVQRVATITGDLSGIINILCGSVRFRDGYDAVITFNDYPTTGGNGHQLNINGQTGANSSGVTNGGNILISSGGPGDGGGKVGSVLLGAGGFNLVQLSEPTTGNRVLSLNSNAVVTSAQMPAGTGDLVTYIRNAAVVPTLGANPFSGAILYASGGALFVKQSDGTEFQIGSISNPNTWGPTGAQVISTRVTTTTDSSNTAFNIYSYAMAPNTTTRVDVIMLGKRVGSAQAAQINMSASFYWDGAAQQMMGTTTLTDYKYTADVSGVPWVDPTIDLSGTSARVQTGATIHPINWLAIIQITVLQG